MKRRIWTAPDLNGKVYSEMLGALTLDFRAMINANTVTFPGSSMMYN